MEQERQTERAAPYEDAPVDETQAEEEQEDFAQLLAETRTERGGRLRRGQRVEAVIVKITPDWIFLDVGGKSEGTLERRELVDAEGNLTVTEGQTLPVYFLSSRENEQIFTTRISSGEAARNFLEDAWRNGIPVEGLVEKEVKGGYEVKIAGSMRGFCPFSHTGFMKTGDTGEFLGKRHQFKIIEYRERGRNIILSRRALLEEEMQKRKVELREQLHEGMMVHGKITSVQDFGAFVDIGGIQGLLPISEIGWGRVEDIRQRVSVGEELDVAIVKLDWDRDRITLSLKETQPDPWEGVEMKFPAGSLHTGRVTRLTKFGAFVTLEEGVDGLIHISKLASGKKINHPGEVLKQGQAVTVRVEKVDPEKRRIALVPEESEEEALEHRGKEDYQRYGTASVNSFGSLGDIFPQRRHRKRG
jgi:small subunit ribosomal protein S1